MTEIEAGSRMAYSRPDRRTIRSSCAKLAIWYYTVMMFTICMSRKGVKNRFAGLRTVHLFAEMFAKSKRVT